MKENNLTQGSIFKGLISFALPYFGANVMQALYSAVDLFTVGQFSGTSAISAVNIGSQIMLIVTGFIIGCSIGTTVTIGMHVGSKNMEKASSALANTIILFAALGLILTCSMLAFSQSLAALMQTPAASYNETVTYVFICTLGIPFIILFNGSAAVFRGLGDSKTPMLVVAIACVINIAGDFLLTGFLRLGVVGVAAATTFAQMISSVAALCLIKKKGLPFEFGIRKIRFHKGIFKDIVYSGLPVAAQDTLINFSFMILTVIANTRGLVASGAVGVVEKLITFMFLVPSSMLSAITAITAQNIGAGKKERAVKATHYGMIVTAVFGCIMAALSWTCPRALTGIFTTDKEVIDAATEYLKTYSLDCILVAYTFCINGYLCGIGKSFVSFIHSVLGIFLVRIPVAMLLSALFPNTLLPMGLASPLGSAFSILVLTVYFTVQKKKGQPIFQ